MVSVRRCCACIILIVIGLILPGCKDKGAASGSGSGETAANQDQVDAVRNAITADMQEVAFASLTENHVGRKCVITARTMEDTSKLGPPPPPPGMVRLMGETTFYRGELDEVSPGTLTVRAPYPTPGNFKRLQIAKEDIQFIHLAQ